MKKHWTVGEVHLIARELGYTLSGKETKWVIGLTYGNATTKDQINRKRDY